MTPKEQRDYELGRIRYSIEHYKGQIPRCCELIRLFPEDSEMHAFELRNCIFMLRRHIREYKELINKPLR
jgi:hypothetical protein